MTCVGEEAYSVIFPWLPAVVPSETVVALFNVWLTNDQLMLAVPGYAVPAGNAVTHPNEDDVDVTAMLPTKPSAREPAGGRTAAMETSRISPAPKRPPLERLS